MVHSIFGPTIQGEGGMAGLCTFFVRFTGCNVWDGRSETRKDALCWFCDTDFYGGTRMTAQEIVKSVQSLGGQIGSWVTLTGGEPLLQADWELFCEFYRYGFCLSIETNGTRPLPGGLFAGHLSLSPKVTRSGCKIERADSLKILYPYIGPGIDAESWLDFPTVSRFIQPIDTSLDGGALSANVAGAVAEVKRLGGGWRVGLQIHKHLGEA